MMISQKIHEKTAVWKGCRDIKLNEQPYMHGPIRCAAGLPNHLTQPEKGASAPSPRPRMRSLQSDYNRRGRAGGASP